MPEHPLPPLFSPTDEWLALVHSRLGNLVGILGEIRDAVVPREPDPPAESNARPVELREPDAGPTANAAEPEPVKATEPEPTKKAPAKRTPRRAATKK